MPLSADRGSHVQSSMQPELIQAPGVIPAQPIVARIRRLIVLAVLAAVVYGVLTVASKSYCAGGVKADGTFIDSSGAPIAFAPNCVNLTLRPSVFVYIGIIAIVIGALTVVLRKASDLPSALRSLDRAAAAVAILAVASTVISQVWFGMIPITDGTYFYPFPFGSVDYVSTPMETQ